MTANNDVHRKDFFLVGVGASAGGLEALEKLFNNIPDKTGMAYVVIQHLSPDYKSMMMELLSKFTNMRLRRIEDSMEIEPDTVYLIPPKKNVELNEGKFKLLDRPDIHSLNLPIDIFFKSLAYEYGEKSIGIVLSGTGTDGTLGVRSIKEYGGLVIVQEPETSKFDGMPRSALSTGIADYVLSPEDIPYQIMKYIKHPVIAKSVNEPPTPLKSEDHMAKIYQLLKNRFGLDFTYYKKSTIYRRVERRLGIKQFSDLEDYVEFLKNNPGEMDSLYKELLIGVTKFFRDYEAYEFLKKNVVPEIIRSKSKFGEKEIRCWIPGCSTGEEAFSLAIIFLEQLEVEGVNLDLKIFATDIDKGALDYAGNGFYPESIVADISSERLMKYFIKEGDYYKINDKVRKKVIFAKHNLIQDPPFNKIDLVSCRNLLIYFQPLLQKRVLSYMYFALKKSGYLFLGSSETVGDMDYLFRNIHNKWKIFQKIGETNRLVLSNLHPGIGDKGMKEHSEVDHSGLTRAVSKDEDIIESAKEAVIRSNLPPTVVVDEHYNLYYVMNDADRYIRFPRGKAQFNILHLVPKSLSTLLSTLINKAQKEWKKTVYKNIAMDDNTYIDLKVEPCETEKSGRKYYLVIFEESKVKTYDFEDRNDGHYSDDLKQRIKDLEQELSYTKENLQATIEELETSNEELQTTNEELLSSNEELQSTNEELQSVNEELITVNAEYQNKIEELTELNNDVNNLLAATEIGTVFLDSSLCVRKYTSTVSHNIFLIESDIGRPIKHISHNFIDINLYNLCLHVFQQNETIEREVRTKDGKTCILRILPYRISEKHIKGVVITLMDVTELSEANNQLRMISQAIEMSPSAVVITDDSGNIEYVNHSFENITGYSFNEVYNKSTNILKSGKHSKSFYDKLWKTVCQGDVWKGEFVNKKKNGELYTEDAVIVPGKDGNGNIVKFVKLANDTTAQKEYMEELSKIKLFMEKLEEPVFVINSDARFSFVNESMQEFTGYNKNELMKKTIYDLCPSFSNAMWSQIRDDVKEKGIITRSIKIRKSDGSDVTHDVKLINTETVDDHYIYSIIN